MPKKTTRSKRELRNIRIQSMIFIAIGVIVIISMVLALIAK